MAWSTSAIFREWVSQVFQVSGTNYTGLDSDSVKAAIYNNTGTPDKDAAVASTGYNTGQWVTANEITGASEWVAGGRALASKTLTVPASGTFMFDAADLTGVASVTMSGIQGCLVYDDSITAGTVADQGICFNYFGGALAVTSGQFSISWNSNGILRFTV